MQPTNLSGMLELDEIINGYLDENLMPQSKYRRISGLAIRGWRLFYRDSTGFPQETVLTVLANGTAVLPVGALNSISVSVLNQRGEKASLVYDSLLAFTDAESPTRTSQHTEQTLATGEEILFSLQDSGNLGYVGYGGFGQYGVGSQPTTGRYNIDWENRVMVFQFHHFHPTQVIFEYLSAPCNDGVYMIHPFFEEPLIDYITWRQIKGNPKASKSEKAEAKRDYDVSYRNARFSMTPFDPSQMYNQFRQSERLSPKT